MSTSTTTKKQCVTCNKSGGILICDGCQQMFCGKHVYEHRQELSGQLDNVMQEHDLFQQELEEESLSKENTLLTKINQWEKDSIGKIQAAAEMARKTLQDLLGQTKEQVSNKCRDIREKLRSAREADDFAENELAQWKTQLKELQIEILSLPSARLVHDKKAPIHLIKLETKDIFNNESEKNQEPPQKTNSSPLDLHERFFQTWGPMELGENNLVARHNGSTLSEAYVRGRLSYSAGCHMIRFKLEKFQKPYRIFFGCMSTQKALEDHAFRSNNTVGWFGSNQVYEHGRCNNNTQEHGYNSTKLQINDELYLIIDCDKKHIRLYHDRLRETYKISINTSLAPLPWQYLVVLGYPDDCVSILPNI